MVKYFSNKSEIKNFRKKLRNKSTSAESVLWDLLKSKQISGRKFRRQHSLGNYIVDFYCSSERLIIELDGDPHGEYYKIEKDLERDEYLINLGYEVVRFENKLVFQDPEYIIRKINENFKSSSEPPPPENNILQNDVVKRSKNHPVLPIRQDTPPLKRRGNDKFLKS